MLCIVKKLYMEKCFEEEGVTNSVKSCGWSSQKMTEN